VITYAEFAALHEEHLARWEDFGPVRSQQFLASSQFVSAKDYLRALRLIDYVRFGLAEAMREADVLITPGVVAGAPLLGDDFQLYSENLPLPLAGTLARTTSICNLGGVPALSIPSGLNRAGLPLGIQLIGRPNEDLMCLRVGEAFQSATDYHALAPPLLSESSLANP
jgi:aspartyl-tRNA(Asn)/glutamyl-tRNA(Gln) amidotransferase subunit A